MFIIVIQICARSPSWLPMRTVFRYTMLPCTLTQAAAANWIESLRHRAIDTCIDFNEVHASYIFCVVAAYRHVIGRTFGKNDANACEAQEVKCVSIVFILVYLVPLLYIVYLKLASRRRPFR